MVIQENMSIQRKLEILSDAAKYDVACTSSGVERKGNGSGLGNSVAAGICHSFSADGRCISLLKILFTNECIFDCKYCLNRSSNDVVRASFTPEEVSELTMEFYRRNYIEGLFLSSGILGSPNYTMELILQAIRLLREVHHFNGYIHCKAIPGADPVLIEMLGWYTDRMSVNLELPTAEGLRNLAPHKNRKNILKPIRQIQLQRKNQIDYLGLKDQQSYSDHFSDESSLFSSKSQSKQNILLQSNYENKQSVISNYNFNSQSGMINQSDLLNQRVSLLPNRIIKSDHQDFLDIITDNRSVSNNYKPTMNQRNFVPAGQSTQMIIGATMESDYQIMTVAESLYQGFDLKRVFYSAFINVNEDSSLPTTSQGPPLLREHRLYQADWLLRFYGFTTSELLDEKNQNFNVFLDPKCDWALRHLELFPVEINRADYQTLLRVPGIGMNSARRIIMARKSAILDFKDLKKMGIVLKRAHYFITCNGKMMYQLNIDENFITRQLLGLKDNIPKGIEPDITYKQLSLFDVTNFTKFQVS